MSQLESLLTGNYTPLPARRCSMSHSAITAVPGVTERVVLTDFLKLYKELEYLWDPLHNDYTSKEKRLEGYNLLLEKYKLIEKDATLKMVKKKIGKMVYSYQRQRKKVFISRLRKGKELVTTLWYYDLMTFLDERRDRLPPDIGNYTFMDDDNEDSDDHARKRPKRSKLTRVYVTEDQESDNNEIEESDDRSEQIEDHLEEIQDSKDHLEEIRHTEGHMEETQDTVNRSTQETNNSRMSHISEKTITAARMTEGEAFGKAIGLQLNELEPTQKYIAEKLISEVIFYARFEKLSIVTRLSNV